MASGTALTINPRKERLGDEELHSPQPLDCAKLGALLATNATL
jgi:hypothetical protein